MKLMILLLMSGLLGVECATAQTNATQSISEREYAQVSKRILDRVLALKETFASMSNMTSAVRFEHDVTWVLDDPTKPHSKLNGRHAVFGKDGYWFSLQFYRGQWGGAADFVPIEFGDLKLWFQFGHGGNTAEIAAVTSILREENKEFCKKHPWQSPDQSLKATGKPAP